MHDDRMRREIAWRIAVLCLAMAAQVFFSGSALAVDGVIEINQAKALAGGVTASDTAGFPVTIDTPGNYRLTSNLQASGAATNGIEIVSIVFGGVEIDLNGFELSGGTSCIFLAGSVTCNQGTGIGIVSTTTFMLDRVKGGVVRFFGGGAIKDIGSVENLTVFLTGGNGITDAVVVRRVGAFFNVGVGIDTKGAAVVESSLAAENNSHGFSISSDSVLRNCTADDNGGSGYNVVSSDVAISESSANSNAAHGFLAADGVTLDRVTASGNGEDGIQLGTNGIVRNSTARFNDGDGIEVGEGSSVIGSTASSNSGTAAGTSPDNEGHGIFSTGAGVRVEGSTARSNAGDGIRVPGKGSLVKDSTATANAGDGIQVGASGLVIGSTAADNTGTLSGTSPDNDGHGIFSSGSSTQVLDSMARDNAGDGIRLSNSTGTVSRCTAFSNDGDGIQVESTTTVIGCSARDNTGWGIRFPAAGSAGWKDNIVNLNTAGTVTGNQVQIGTNMCGGNTTCP